MVHTLESAVSAAQSLLHHDPFIGGTYRSSDDTEALPCIFPGSQVTFASINQSTTNDVDVAVTLARRAFEAGSWSRASPSERKSKLLKLAELIETNLETLALLETIDTGKPLQDIRAVDLPETVASLRWHAESIDKIYGQHAPTSREILGIIIQEPVGVVAAVLPWNFPLMMMMWKVAPALAAGNSVIIKPAEQTNLTTLAFGKLASEAGIPEGVISVLPGRGETVGKALGEHMDIDCIAFTGSTATGRRFLEYSARTNLKRVSLECGGKSPAIVFADCSPIAEVANYVATAINFCAGQNCTANSRLLLDAKIYDEFMEKLKTEFRLWLAGDPFAPETKVGPLIDKDQYERVSGLVSGAQNQGALMTYVGGYVSPTHGLLYYPTILENVNDAMTIFTEEVFGPVLAVTKFETEDEALNLANKSAYGLAASIYTSSLSRAKRMSFDLKAGVVSVNCYSEGDNSTPFGGFKQSGFGGRDRSFAAHSQYTETKTIWMNCN